MKVQIEVENLKTTIAALDGATAMYNDILSKVEELGYGGSTYYLLHRSCASEFRNQVVALKSMLLQLKDTYTQECGNHENRN